MGHTHIYGLGCYLYVCFLPLSDAGTPPVNASRHCDGVETQRDGERGHGAQGHGNTGREVPVFWTMTSLDVSMLIRVVRPYVKLLLQLPVMVRKIMYNRTAAVVVGSLLYTIRGTLWVALLRGKWVGWAWSRLQRRRQLRNFEESNFDNRAQAALYIPRQFVNGSPHRVAKRTLFEDSLVNLLYGNMPAANAMRRATRRCTQAMPF